MKVKDCLLLQETQDLLTTGSVQPLCLTQMKLALWSQKQSHFLVIALWLD